MTQEFLQDAMVADLKELFAHERLKVPWASSGRSRSTPRMCRSGKATMKPGQESTAGAVCGGAPPGRKDRKRR